MNEAYKALGVSENVLAFSETILSDLKDRFAAIDAIAEANQLKVIAAMQKNRVSAECFNISSGYGYNDMGRDTLERVYADCFGGEDALVRPQITCGTHALALALMSNLRPGDELLSPVGKPYDTLEEVIGIRPSKGSLAEYGITYSQVDLLPDGSFDYDGIRAAIGPCIGLCCFEVGPEVPEAMRNALGADAEPFFEPRGEKYHVDLKGLNRLWLERAGLSEIDVCPDCTRCQPERFWSHRAVGNQRGSQAAIIMRKE